MIQRNNRSLNPWRLFEEALNQGDQYGTGSYGGVVSELAGFPLDVLDENDHLVVKMNLPGVSAESVDISLEGTTLTLSAKLEDDAGNGGRYLYRERPAGMVRRAITLPVRLSHEGTEANLENGVLTIRLNKAPEATARRIEVQAGGQRKAIAG